MLKSFLLSAATVAAFVPSIAWADDGTETVVVSATRVATPVAQVGSSISVIDADQIAAQQERTLPDALQAVPGLDVVQTGGAGGATSLFMRGANSNHVKVLLDGIDLSDQSTPNDAPDISKLLTGDIARIEVLRGPQSGLYGSDAIGGVISIITKTGQGAPTFNAGVEGGSFDTFNQQASLSGSEGDFHYRLSADHIRSGATPVTPQAYLTPGTPRHDNSFDGVQISTRLGYDVTDNFDLGFAGHYGSSVGRVTNDAFDFVNSTLSPSAFQTRNTTLQYDGRATAHLVLGRFDQTLGLAYTSSITSSDDPDNGYVLARGSRIKLDWQGNAAVADGQTLVLGAETARDTNPSGFSFGFPTGPAAGMTTNAGFAELQSDFGDGFFNSASVRYDDNSLFGGRMTYHVAPVWLIPGTGTKLKASFGTGFKAPALQQLFNGFGANTALKPETSTGYDAGFEQSLLDNAVSVGATWFHNDIHNLITNGPAPFFLFANVKAARTQGVESFVAWSPLQTLSLRADYTYTDAIDGSTRAALARRPRNKLSVSADWQVLSDVSLDAVLITVGPQADLDRESGAALRMPSYALLNLAANWRVTDNWTLFGRLDNAFDTRYESPEGFLRPGIGGFAGIKANF